ncbi:hypothetical protein ACROYT_G039947 [Oculina patagonica]
MKLRRAEGKHPSIRLAGTWSGVDNRIEIQWGGITEAECKQRCPDCAAIEYWSGATKTCWECIDHTKRRPYTNTEDGSYPPHVFVRI